jgi:hypothetical protein
MERPTIYNLSDTVYRDYALKQASYEEQVAEGVISPRGDLETAASSAASIRNVTRQLPQLAILTGSYVRTEIALFMPPAPEWQVMRSTSIYEAPALGSIEKRQADIQKLEGVAQSMAGAAQDREALLMIRAAIEQTIRDDQEILYAKGLIASILSG